MRFEVKFFVEQASSFFDFPEPILEIGALQVEGQEGVADLRPFFPGKRYIGTDIRPGPGVDRIEDAQNLSFPNGSIGSVICCDTLEHIPNIWRATEEMVRVLCKGGVLLITSVMKYPIHDYPGDYWRFTPQAFSYLLRHVGTFAVFFQGDEDFPEGVYGIGIKGKEAPSLNKFSELIVEGTASWSSPIRLYEVLEKTPDMPEGSHNLFEDSEGALRYEYRIDPALQTEDAPCKLLRMVPKGARVLEIGCAGGHMSTFMQNKLGCEVVAVEVDERAAEVAKKRGVSVVVGDIEDKSTLGQIEGKFDCVIFADVLEHLKRPDEVLQEIRTFLKQNGFVLASIPNVSYIGLVAELMRGFFRYRRCGLLDRTHLRFFTKEGIVELFERSGYFISQIERVKLKPDETEFNPPQQELALLIEKHNPEAYVYQYVIKALPMSEENSLQRSYEKLLKMEEQLRQLNRELESKEKTLRDVFHALSEKEELISNLNQKLFQLEQEKQQLSSEKELTEQQRDELQKLLEEIFSSKGWKLLEFLRKVKRLCLMRR